MAQPGFCLVELLLEVVVENNVDALDLFRATKSGSFLHLSQEVRLGIAVVHFRRVAGIEISHRLDVQLNPLLFHSLCHGCQAHDVRLRQEVVVHRIVNDVPSKKFDFRPRLIINNCRQKVQCRQLKNIL
jgi:hypothetical protein